VAIVTDLLLLNLELFHKACLADAPQPIGLGLPLQLFLQHLPTSHTVVWVENKG